MIIEDSYLSLDIAIRDANLPKSVEKMLLETFESGEEKIPVLRASKLIILLSNLRSGRFKNLSIIDKKKLLQNFFDLLKFRKVESITRICHLFFKGRISKKGIKAFLPQEMIEALIMMGRVEKAQTIKEMIWDFLIRKEVLLENYILPDELIFGLWLDNPVFRNNVMKFLFLHFKPEPVMNSIITHISKTGKTIPVHASRRFIWLAIEEKKLKQKRQLLAGILKSSQLTDKEIDRVWSDYLRGLNRFELIKTGMTNTKKFNWIGNLKKEFSQLSFDFKPQEEISYLFKLFHYRISNIQKYGTNKYH